MANGYDGSITIDTQLDTKGFDSGSKELIGAIKSLTTQINELGKTTQTMLGAMQSLSTQIANVAQNVQKTSTAHKSMSRSAKESANAMKSAADASQDAMSQYEDATRAVKDLETALADANDKWTSMESDFLDSQQVQDLLQRIEELRGAAEKYKRLMSSSSQSDRQEAAGIAMQYNGDPTVKLKEAEAEFDKLNEKFEKSSSFRKAVDEASQLEQKLAQARAQAESIKPIQIASLGATPIPSSVIPVEALKSALTGLGERVKSAASSFLSSLHPVEALKSAFTGLAERAKSAARGMIQAVSQRIVSGLRSIASHALSASKSMLGLGKSAKRSSSFMNSSFGQLLRYGLGIRSLFVLFNRLRSAAKEGISNLSNYDAPLRASINSMSGALTSLKNSFATAFSPIITTVAPYIVYLINLLNAAITKIAQFFAALTGKSTYTKAATGLENVGAAGNSAASGAGKAAKAAKEAERQLGKFDELDILKDTSSDNGGSGGGGGGGAGGGAGTAGMFTTENVPEEVMEFANRLKEAIKNADWESAGKMLGEKVNELVNMIPWEEFGHKLGYGLNGAIQTLYWFLDTVDFNNIGSKIASLLNAALEEIDFTYLGRLLVKKYTIILDTAIGFLSTLDWGLVAKSVSDCFIGAFQESTKWIKKYNWSEMGTGLYSGIKDAITGVNWSELARSAFEFLGSALGALSGFLAGFIGEAISDAFTGISTYFSDKVEESGGDVVDGILKGITDGLKNIGTWIVDNIFTPFIDGFKSAFGIHSPAKEMKDPGKDVGLGILEGIKSAFKNPKKWVEKNILTPLSKEFGKLKLAFKATVELVKKGWSTVKGWIQSVGGALKQTAEVVLKKAQSWAGGVASWVKSVGGGLKTTVTVGLTKAGEWSNSVSSWLGDLSAKVSLIPEATGDFLKNDMTSFLKDPLAYVKMLGKSGDKYTKGGNVTSALDKKATADVAMNGKANNAFTRGGDVTSAAKNPKANVSMYGKASDAFTKGGNVTESAKKPWSYVGMYGQAKDAMTKGGNVTSAMKNPWSYVAGWIQKASGQKNDASGKFSSVWSNVSGYITKASGQKNDASGKFSSVYSDIKGYIKKAKDQKNDVSDKFSSLYANINAKVKAAGRAVGGIITRNGIRNFASGGMIKNGVSSWWDRIPKYAGGTANAHGTAFIAGEAGPEIVGHIGGRTEVLNRSQLASTMYAAIISAMNEGVRTIGSYLGNIMIRVGNAEIGAILSSTQVLADTVAFTVPAMATGTVMPYDISTLFEKQTTDLQKTMDENNEILISAVASAISAQTMSLISAIQQNANVSVQGGMTAQQMIDDINRRTVMFNASPLKA